MGMETLNTAARAAGFAMAGTEEIFEERRPEPVPVSAGTALVPTAPIRPQGMMEWLRSYLGFLGGRAPASPA
jgi:hypothetical protein